MNKNQFGWSYPPGCNSVPGDDEGPCYVCGRAVDNCICPECPECGDFGNPDCYVLNDKLNHGLKLNIDQMIGRSKIKQSELLECVQDEKTYQSWLEQPEHAKYVFDIEGNLIGEN